MIIHSKNIDSIFFFFQKMNIIQPSRKSNRPILCVLYISALSRSLAIACRFQGISLLLTFEERWITLVYIVRILSKKADYKQIRSAYKISFVVVSLRWYQLGYDLSEHRQHVPSHEIIRCRFAVTRDTDNRSGGFRYRGIILDIVSSSLKTCKSKRDVLYIYLCMFTYISNNFLVLTYFI